MIYSQEELKKYKERLRCKRVLRRSFYNDYIAIDLVDENNKIVDTILYLKKGDSKSCKIRWEFAIHNSSGRHEESLMDSGEIRFDGEKIESTYTDLQSGIYWTEVAEYELLSNVHYHFNKL